MFQNRRLAASFSLALCIVLPAPCQAAAPAGSLSGRVLDSMQRAIVGATICLHKFNDPFSGKAGQWGVSIAKTQTDGNGHFRFLETDALPFDGKFMLAVKSEGRASAFRKTTLEAGQDVSVELSMGKPTTVVLRLFDEGGRPVRDAYLRRLNVHGEIGEFDPRCDDFEKFGLSLETSDEQGRLRLPELPQGAVVDAMVAHQDYAAIEVEGIAIRPENAVAAMMKPGLPVHLRVASTKDRKLPSDVTVLLRHSRFGSAHPSTMWLERLDIDANGEAKLTAEAGTYSILLLDEDFYVVSTNLPADELIRLDAGEERRFAFEAHAKVRVKGRVIDAASGRPAPGVSVDGEILRGISSAAGERASNDWASATSVDTGQHGEYSIALAAGPARLAATGIGYVTDGEPIEIVVAADGSTTVPDLKVRRLPKVSGTVRNAGGRPVAGAIVRMRGQMCGMQPVTTDERGRFELSLPWLRYDPETGKPRFVQPLAAFHPLESLSTEVDVNLEDSLAISNLNLQLAPCDCRSLLPAPDMPGEGGTKDAAELAMQSLQGKPAPELDGLLWLNAPREKMRLADFRGNYVLLDFWTTWCGPCHADFPTIKLLHGLYKDRGLTVIGIHDNSVAPDAVREHVKRQDLNFPVVIDTPDGKILSRYKPHGVRFYPSYLLIGPNGNVLLHDGVIPGPELDSYMLEIVRAYLIER